MPVGRPIRAAHGQTPIHFAHARVDRHRDSGGWHGHGQRMTRGDRLERADRHDAHAERQRQALRDAATDAQAGEGTGPGPIGDGLEGIRRDARVAQQPVHRGQREFRVALPDRFMEIDDRPRRPHAIVQRHRQMAGRCVDCEQRHEVKEDGIVTFEGQEDGWTDASGVVLPASGQACLEGAGPTDPPILLGPGRSRAVLRPRGPAQATNARHAIPA